MKNEYLQKENEELIKRIRDYLKEGGLASVTAFQRKFRIGFSRACMILDALAELGVVAETSTGSTPKREVNMDRLSLLDGYVK